MERGKRCIFFLWCILTMAINGRRAFHVPSGDGDERGSLQMASESFSSDGTSLHVLDMYKSYSDSQASGQQLPYGSSTTIRSFSSDGELLAEGRQLYDLTIPNEEEIVGAELHVFISESIFKLPDETNSLKLQLFVIQEEFAVLIEERTVDANDFGWQVFNVKSTVEKWHDSQNQNQGFKVKALDSSEKDISSEIIRSWQRSYEPVLIVFSDVSESIPLSIGSEISNKVESLLKSENMHFPARKIRSVTNHTNDEDTDDYNDACQRHEMHLNFEDLGWTFIIYPESFDASYCSGACNAQKVTDVSTYHDLVLCKAYEVGKISRKIAPNCEPSCGPIKYESLRVIYKVNDSIVSEVLPKMVVTDCGCQKM